MEKKKMSLPVQIVLALILGIVVGLIFYFIGKPEITTNYPSGLAGNSHL